MLQVIFHILEEVYQYVKKIVSLFLVAVTFLCMSVPAFALDAPITVSSPEVTIINCSSKIPASALAEIEKAVSAQVTLTDGTVIPIASTVTVEDVSSSVYSTNAISSENSYKVTVQATASDDKIVSDSGEHNYSNIRVSATLQLIWTDGPGLNNVIKKVSGTRTVLKGSVNYAKVQWGDGWRSALTWTEKDVTNVNSFSYSPSVTVNCPKAQYSIMMVDEPIGSLLLTVSSSVLQ